MKFNNGKLSKNRKRRPLLAKEHEFLVLISLGILLFQISFVAPYLNHQNNSNQSFMLDRSSLINDRAEYSFIPSSNQITDVQVSFNGSNYQSFNQFDEIILEIVIESNNLPVFYILYENSVEKRIGTLQNESTTMFFKLNTTSIQSYELEIELYDIQVQDSAISPQDLLGVWTYNYSIISPPDSPMDSFGNMIVPIIGVAFTSIVLYFPFKTILKKLLKRESILKSPQLASSGLGSLSPSLNTQISSNLLLSKKGVAKSLLEIKNPRGDVTLDINDLSDQEFLKKFKKF